MSVVYSLGQKASITPDQVTLTSPYDSSARYNLAQGDNIIVIPGGCSFLSITPPSGNTTVNLFLNGLSISRHLKSVIALGGDALDTGSNPIVPTQFTLNASAPLTGVLISFDGK